MAGLKIAHLVQHVWAEGEFAVKTRKGDFGTTSHLVCEWEDGFGYFPQEESNAGSSASLRLNTQTKNLRQLTEVFII